jgi:hypothetical protein
MRLIDAERSRLYADLYGGGGWVAGPSRVRLLNPGAPRVDDDATSRRFALLEID